jgi:hypothetical protein
MKLPVVDAITPLGMHRLQKDSAEGGGGAVLDGCWTFGHCRQVGIRRFFCSSSLFCGFGWSDVS